MVLFIEQVRLKVKERMHELYKVTSEIGDLLASKAFHCHCPPKK